MTKKKNNNIWYIIGGIVIVVLILWIILANIGTSTETKKLSEGDFKIISISWLNSPGIVEAFGGEEYNWDEVCNMEGDYWTSKYWSITTQQNYGLTCYPIVNGERLDDYIHFNQGADTQDKELGLNYKMENQLTLCCQLSNTVIGIGEEVCDSINLPAKC